MYKRVSIIAVLLLVACSPVKVKPTNEYILARFSTKKVSKQPSRLTVLVSNTKANDGYQQDDMLYVKKPYQLEAFAKNRWVAPPAKMLNDLLIESLQNANYFHAVVSPPFVGESDYQINTYLLALEQNFLKRPSFITLSIKADIINTKTDKVVASHRFHVNQQAQSDTPYGGVIAANMASKKIMTRIVSFLVNAARKRAA